MDSQTSKRLVEELLSKRKNKFSPLEPIFAPHLEELSIAVGIPGAEIKEVIFNALNGVYGRGACLVCNQPTKLHVPRGWAIYCSKSCMNSSNSPRVQKAENTKQIRGTSIGNSSVREKSKNTLLLNYGVENPSCSKLIVEKRKNTCLDRFGESSPLKSKDVKKKIKQTLQDKYQGSGNQSPEISRKISISRRTRSLEKLREKLTDWEIITDSKDWKGAQVEPLKLKHSCGRILEVLAWCGTKELQPICRTCEPNSKPQGKLIDLLTELKVDFLVNDRKLIKPLELDILIPERSLAIEVDGIYYHGERSGKSHDYHLNKTLLVEDKGFQLLHFTDLEINTRWNAVSTMIRSKLGILDRVPARKLKIQRISSSDAKEFLEAWHVAGSTRSSIAYGLFLESELVSVMTFGRPRFNKTATWELLRYDLLLLNLSRAGLLSS